MPSSPKKIVRPWNIKRKKHERSIDNSFFYNSWTWRKKRKKHLNKFPLCVECERKGFIKNANVVDHIKPISVGGCKLCDDNLQSMCDSCHNSKSGKESRGFSIKKGV